MSKNAFTPADVRRLTSVEAKRHGRVHPGTLPAKAQSAVDTRLAARQGKAQRPAPAQPAPPRPPKPRPPNGPSTTGGISGKNRGNNPPAR